MGKLTPGEIIQGTGKINKNYIESIKQMICVTLKGDKDYGENDHYYHVAKHFGIYLESQQKQAWQDFNDCLTQLNEEYKRLLGKKETVEAANQAKQLHNRLIGAATTYQDDKNYYQFKQTCENILNDDSYKTLKEKMEWDAWKSNVILAICTIGIGYAIVGGIKSLFTGQFHFYHSKFDQVQTSANLISAWSKSHEIIAHRKISQEIF
ncbi:MAG: hypothetical protein GY782_11900 [Gammaproteobacteria bacterium]|nr:hypothetical protein [Gammaproteobacteria bacterium]